MKKLKEAISIIILFLSIFGICYFTVIAADYETESYFELKDNK